MRIGGWRGGGALSPALFVSAMAQEMECENCATGGAFLRLCKIMRTHIQRQIHTQHIHPPQQLLPTHPPRAALLFRVQPMPVMVHDAHSQRRSLAREVLPDAAHAQDAEHLALWIVAQRGRRIAAPGAVAEGEHGGVEVAEGAEEEEERGVGCGGVDGRGDVRDGDAGEGAVCG